MAIGYFALAIAIVLLNIRQLPAVLHLIIDDAFGIRQAAGGGFGITLMMGIKRGLFMTLLTATNLLAIIFLAKYAFRLLDDYRRQKREGHASPTFHRSQLPELDLDCWE